ncbi:MAG TPA: ribosome assembly cofactor RimP [Candidatus Tidjanibacter gallistercoris]|nr:ribosome assembly cofactor RimP [Candidatus Tidjanibacter gallistercoris]
MTDTEKIKAIAESELAGGSLFLVEVNVTPGNEIEVVIDSDGSVDIDDCVALSRAIEERLDRDEEDFELTVTSAGIGRPLKLLRQYRKLIGRPVEVLLHDGTKIIAELRDADAQSLTLAYTEMRPVEGKKRRQATDVVRTYPLSEIKSTKEYLDFK